LAKEKTIIENSDLKDIAEDFFGTANHNIQVVYILLISFLFVVAILMAIVRIPVYFESGGILRPCSDKKQICSPLQGIVKTIMVEENQKVNKGDLILIIDSEREMVQLELLKKELLSITAWIDDCRYLVNFDKVMFDSIYTAKYQADFIVFSQETEILDMEIKQIRTDISRLKPLEADSLISKKEMEDTEFKYANLVGKRKSLISTKKNQWQDQLDNSIQKQILILREIVSLDHIIKNSSLRSPTAGIVQGIRNIFPGDFCTAGRLVCYLIPDTGMVIEMFIPSKDIGFIEPGIKTRFKIDAFDYKYWGFIEGTCISVSKDYEVVENRPFFRVICKPEESGRLKYQDKIAVLSPGMTVTTQFLFTSRNMWQLLRDKYVDRIK
jgi:membrane fusion protein, peptide pheromone/bacteriocin exporter